MTVPQALKKCQKSRKNKATTIGTQTWNSKMMTMVDSSLHVSQMETGLVATNARTRQGKTFPQDFSGSLLTDIVANIYVAERGWKNHQSHVNPESELLRITKQGILIS
jgi:hypothetical protein